MSLKKILSLFLLSFSLIGISNADFNDRVLESDDELSQIIKTFGGVAGVCSLWTAWKVGNAICAFIKDKKNSSGIILLTIP